MEFLKKKWLRCEALLRALIEAEKLSDLIPRLIMIGAVATGLITLAWVLMFWDVPFSPDPAHWGQFGDFVGGILATIFAAFSFVGILVTVMVQGKAVTGQLKAIEQEREIKDDEAYLNAAVACLQRAYKTIHDETENAPLRDRKKWLNCARWIIKSSESASYIRHPSTKLLYESDAESWREKFRDLLDPDGAFHRSMQPSYFHGTDGDRTLDADSVYVIYNFLHWPEGRTDVLDNVGRWDMDTISKRYRGARNYLKERLEARATNE
ncbi:hypothetical protein FQZ97_484170 [compost metagenome]